MRSLVAIMSSLLFFLACGEKKADAPVKNSVTVSTTLPFLGEPEIKYRTENGVSIADTIPHQIPPFSFTDQDGNPFTEQDVAGKIYVADFIFTSCPSICPVMTGNMLKVQQAFKNDERIMIVSHTIDPEYDTPEVLKKYAAEKGADTRQWKFLTGDRETIYSLCENEYMAFAKKDLGAPGGYVHSGFFVLIDKNRHIRGAYDGTEEGKTEALIKDIQILLNEK
jgi:protein SCO1/2